MAERDPRFGGNIERANVRRPPSNIEYDRMGGGPAIGNTAGRTPWGNEADIHRYKTGHLPGFGIVGQGRNIPRQTGTSNFGGTYSHELGHTGGYDFNPRPNLRGRFPQPGFHRFPQSGPAGAPVEGPWNREYDTPMRGGLGGLEQQQSKVNLMDLYDRLGPNVNWNRLLRQMDERGIEYADMGGTYADPYEGLDIIDMEILPGIGYGGDNEYDFDYERNRFDDLISWPSYGARGGLMSLRR